MIMINIGRYSSFGTTNYAQNLLKIKDNNSWHQFLDLETSDFIVIGGGTNILFTQDNYKNIFFIKNNLTGIEYLGDQIIKVQAGELLINVVKWVEQNLRTNILNPIYGLPGSVGGAVIGNAESFGTRIGDYVQQVVFYNQKKELINNFKYVATYRHSNLSDQKIFLKEIILNFAQTKNRNMQDNSRSQEDIKPCDYYLNRRLLHHENKKTCGSYFKNIYLLNSGENIQKIEYILDFPDNPILKFYGNHYQQHKEFKIPAAWLIDKCNLKGLSIGGVKISDKHANFIVNYANQDSKNILNLAQIIKNSVQEKFKVSLEEEVKLI